MNFKKVLSVGFSVFVTILLSVGVVSAIGSLQPTGSVGDDTAYTTNDVYDKLSDFTDTASATSSPFTTPGSVSASFRTMTEIYNLLLDEDSDLVAANIADGTTIFGVDGSLSAGGGFSPSLNNVSIITWSDNDPGGVGDLNFDTASTTCNRLENDGSTVNASAQNIYRLPTIFELIHGRFVTDPNGWDEAYYWSSTEAIDYGIDDGFLQFHMDSDALNETATSTVNVIRCVEI